MGENFAAIGLLIFLAVGLLYAIQERPEKIRAAQNWTHDIIMHFATGGIPGPCAERMADQITYLEQRQPISATCHVIDYKAFATVDGAKTWFANYGTWPADYRNVRVGPVHAYVVRCDFAQPTYIQGLLGGATVDHLNYGYIYDSNCNLLGG